MSSIDRGDHKRQISRRSFVRGVAGVGAFAATSGLMACSPKQSGGGSATEGETGSSGGASGWREPPSAIPEADITEEKSADVVVIGLGHSGTSCARWIAEQGGSVIAIEAQAEESYAALGEDFGHINSKWLASQGVPEVDPVEFFNNWMLNAQNLANPALVMKYARNCGECFDWWADGLGPEFMESVSIDFWPRDEHAISEIAGQKFWTGTAQFVTEHDDGTYDINTTAAMKIFHGLIVENGGQIDWETKADQLVKDGDRVVGVIAKNAAGAYVKYTAAKGVVLAAGDFSGNQEMLDELCTSITDLPLPDGTTMMGAGRDGSGIQMGLWAGGHTEPRGVATMGGDTSHPGISSADMTGVWLNSNGDRFANEFFGDPIWSGRITVQQNLGTVYSLYDGKVVDQLGYNIPAHNRFDPSNPVDVSLFKETLAAAVAAGAAGVEGQGCQIYAADTLDQLADYAGMDAAVKQNFLAAVERYNGFCEVGVDEDFGKDPRVLWKIDTPPYYLGAGPVKMLAFMLVTVGGLETDGNQQVLNSENNPIEGLFATGNSCGKRFGSSYFSPIAGVSVGLANTLGRELGKHLLAL